MNTPQTAHPRQDAMPPAASKEETWEFVPCVGSTCI